VSAGSRRGDHRARCAQQKVQRTGRKERNAQHANGAFVLWQALTTAASHNDMAACCAPNGVVIARRQGNAYAHVAGGQVMKISTAVRVLHRASGRGMAYR